MLIFLVLTAKIALSKRFTFQKWHYKLAVFVE
jgi:hypothetical protein